MTLVRENCRGKMTDTGHALAFNWHQDRVSTKEIARRLHVSPSTVRYNLNRTPPSVRTSSRKPPQLSARVIAARAKRHKLVRKLAMKESIIVGKGGKSGRAKKTVNTVHPFPSCSLIARELASKYNIDVHASTVRRDLKFLGFEARRRPKGPRQYEGDEIARLNFAKAHLSDDVEKILFSDEKYFDCNDHGTVWEWCAKGKKPKHRGYCRWAPKLHIWGCIGVGERLLVIFPRRSRVTQEVYIRHCLKGNLRRFKGKVLMQDGAAPHTGKLTKKFIADHRINVLPNWPPRSPDLNPIENLWAWLSRLVSDMGPTDEDELEQFVIEAWENLDQEEIDELVRTYQRRLEGCIANGGRTLNGLPPAPPKP